MMAGRCSARGFRNGNATGCTLWWIQEPWPALTTSPLDNADFRRVADARQLALPGGLADGVGVTAGVAAHHRAPASTAALTRVSSGR